MIDELLQFNVTNIKIGDETYTLPNEIVIRHSGLETRFPNLDACRNYITSMITKPTNKVGPVLEKLKKKTTDSAVIANIDAVIASIGAKNKKTYSNLKFVKHILIDNKVFEKYLADRTKDLVAPASATVTMVDGSKVTVSGDNLHALLDEYVPVTPGIPLNYLMCNDLEHAEGYHELYQVYPNTIVTTVLKTNVYNYLNSRKGTSPSVKEYVENNRYIVDSRTEANEAAISGLREIPEGTKITITRDKKTKAFVKAVIDYGYDKVTITNETVLKELMMNFTGKTDYSEAELPTEAEKKGVSVKVKYVNSSALKRVLAWGGAVLVAGGIVIGHLTDWFGLKKKEYTDTRSKAVVTDTVDPGKTTAVVTEMINNDTPTNPPVAEEKDLGALALTIYSQGMERLGYEALGDNSYEEIMKQHGLTPSSERPIKAALSYDFEGYDRVVVDYLDQLHNSLVTVHENGVDQMTRYTIVDVTVNLYNFVMNGAPIEVNGKYYYYDNISSDAKRAAFAALYSAVEALKYSDQLNELPVDDINRIMTYIENKQADQGKSLK